MNCPCCGINLVIPIYDCFYCGSCGVITDVVAQSALELSDNPLSWFENAATFERAVVIHSPGFWENALENGRGIIQAGISNILERVGRPLVSPDDLEFLFVLLKFPFDFSDKEFRFKAVGRLIGYIANLDPRLFPFVVDRFKTFDKPCLEQTINLINSFITSQILSDQAYSHQSRLALKTMSLIDAANDVTFTVSLDVFYNTATDSLDLLFDYDNWISGAFFCYCQFPFVLSIGSKIKLLEIESEREKEHKMLQSVVRLLHGQRSSPLLVIKVRRTNLVQDSIKQLEKSKDLKKQLQVNFVGEAGLDAGGLTKEWFLLIVEELNAKEYNLFQLMDDFTWFTFDAPIKEAYLVGIILALAIYNQSIVDINFPLCMYKKLLGRRVGLDAFREIQNATLQRLESMRQMTNEEIESLELYFVFGYTNKKNKYIEVDLIENGKNIKVSKENVEGE